MVRCTGEILARHRWNFVTAKSFTNYAIDSFFSELKQKTSDSCCERSNWSPGSSRVPSLIPYQLSPSLVVFSLRSCLQQRGEYKYGFSSKRKGSLRLISPPSYRWISLNIFMKSRLNLYLKTTCIKYLRVTASTFGIWNFLSSWTCVSTGNFHSPKLSLVLLYLTLSLYGNVFRFGLLSCFWTPVTPLNEMAWLPILCLIDLFRQPIRSQFSEQTWTNVKTSMTLLGFLVVHGRLRWSFLKGAVIFQFLSKYFNPLSPGLFGYSKHDFSLKHCDHSFGCVYKFVHGKFNYGSLPRILCCRRRTWRTSNWVLPRARWPRLCHFRTR